MSKIIAVLRGETTAELASQLSLTNPIAFEEISHAVESYASGIWLQDDVGNPLYELIEQIPVGECQALDESNLLLVPYGGLTDLGDFSGKAGTASKHQALAAEDKIEEDLDYYGISEFLERHTILIHRIR